MITYKRELEKDVLCSFEDVQKEALDNSKWLAIGDNGKDYSATYTTKYGGVMFFCIPSDVNIIGYLKVIG